MSAVAWWACPACGAVQDWPGVRAGEAVACADVDGCGAVFDVEEFMAPRCPHDHVVGECMWCELEDEEAHRRAHAPGKV